MQKKFNAILIVYLMTVVQIGTDLYLPSLPQIQSQLASSSSLAQQTFSIFLAGFALSQLVYGPLCDRFGRKPFILLGTFIYSLMAVVAMLAPSMTVLLVARLIQGLGAGACSVVPRAIMRDSFSGEAFHRVVLYQTLVWALIPVSAPLLGSYIEHYLGWRYNFAGLVVIGVAGFILSMLFKESLVHQETRLHFLDILSAYYAILKHKLFHSHLICAMCVIGALTTFNVSAPLLIQVTLQRTPIEYGWSVFSVGMSFLLGIFINRALMSRYDSHMIATVGLSIMALAVMLLLVFSVFTTFTLFMLLAPMMLLQIGLALLFPSNAANANTIFPEKAGKTAALFGCGIFLGGMATSYSISLFSHRSLLPLASILLILTIIIALFHTRVLILQLKSR